MKKTIYETIKSLNQELESLESRIRELIHSNDVPKPIKKLYEKVYFSYELSELNAFVVEED